MMHHIEKIRSKPEHIRRRFALITSLSITAIIFIFWIVSMSVTKSGPTDSSVAMIKEPSSSLTANISGAFKYVRDILVGANKAEYKAGSQIEVVAGKK